MASKFLVRSRCSTPFHAGRSLCARFYHEYLSNFGSRIFPWRGSLKLFPKNNICDERDSPFLRPSNVLPNLSAELQQASSKEMHTDSCLMTDSLGSSTTAGGAGPIKIKYSIVPREKAAFISRFLYSNYHRTEPITMALGMNLAEVDGWFQRYIRSYMFASIIDVSVEAVDGKARRRVGVLSSVVLDPSRSWPTLEQFLRDKKAHPINAEMQEFFDKVEIGFDPKYERDESGKPKHSRIHEHMFLAVHPQYQSMGISGHMVRLSESLAKNINGCRIGYVVCTSEYSYKLYKKHGYKTVNEVFYKDYVNSKGKKIFEGKESVLGPHVSCKAMTKELPDLYQS